jgi:UDP-N-acetylmuramate--alanine ligase
VGDADTLVVTGALWPDNPEYLLARERGIPVLHRSQALAWLTRSRRLVSVAGAHGKTTSTGMIVTALLALDADPSFVNGGVIETLGTSSAWGSGELFGSFRLYDTAVALVTNVDPDHLDHYGSLEAFQQAFVDFADASTEFVAISSDDPGAVAVTERLTHARVVTFGVAEDAEVRVRDIVTDGPVRFTIDAGGSSYSGTLAVPGRHNAINAAGAFAVLTRSRIRTAGGPRRHRRLRRHEATVRAARHRRRRERLRRLCAPPHRGRRGAVRRSDGRGGRAHHRRTPAASLQPHATVRP